MARERMVTRTVEQSVFTVMQVKVSTAQVETVNYTIGGTYDKAEDALKRLKKLYETNDNKVVSITSTSTETILYGMPEADFIKYATVMPARGTKSDE